MNKSIYQIRFENFRDLIERSGGQSAVAAKLEVNRQRIHSIAPDTGKPARNIGHSFARKIETVYGLPIGSLDLEHRPGAEVKTEVIEVPVLDVTGSMGPGAAQPDYDDVITSMTMSKQWLRMNTQATSFQALGIIIGKGDSMEPTFYDGSILLVDTAVRKIDLDAVYVLSRERELFVKRVQRLISGGLEIVSDNKERYRPQVVENIAKSGLTVNGRVLIAWNGRKL